jgi:hypothetical protein
VTADLRLPLLCLLVPLAAYAQDASGSISGMVVDPAGAAVAGARVELTNVATNVHVTVATNESGNYSMPFLRPGVYRVVASHEGFQKAVRERAELVVGDRVQVDFHLQLGSVTEQVTVSASAEMLQTGEASAGQVMTGAMVSEMPLYGGNPFLLAELAPGIEPTSTNPGTSARPFDNGAGNFSVNGGPLSTTSFSLDGVPNNNNEGNQPARASFVPSPAATAEFRVQTSVYDAQYGRTGGAVVNVSLKSGTNRFHGQLYHYFRNDRLNANRFESNLIGVKRDTLRWNQPGVELDGPVYLPGVYDGRNRTFFMYSWEAVRTTSPWAQLYTVPTLDQLRGDFSTTRLNDGTQVAVYDPFAAQRVGTRWVRTPFAGNVIPASRYDPVAAKLLPYFPKPNTTGFTNNLIATPNAFKDTYDQHIIRADHNLTERHKFFSRYVRNPRTQIMGLAGFPYESSPGYLHGRANTGGNFDLTDVLSPSTVLNTKVGFIRHTFFIFPYGDNFDLVGAGFPAATVAQLPRKVFPRLSMTDYSNVGPGRSIGAEFSDSYTWSFSELLSKMIGGHAVKVGGEFLAIFNNTEAPTSSFGTFSFTRTYTQRDVNLAEAGSGNAFASMLLGIPASGTVPINFASAYGQHYYALFLHDDWRVNSRLTLNLGVRWDYESPTTERYDRQNRGLDRTSPTNFPVPGLQLKGGLRFADANNRLPFPRDLNNFQPRAGVAFRLTRNTVLRGGFGITYMPTYDTGGTLGFSSVTSFAASVDEGQTPLGRLSNPYPAGFIQPAGRSTGLATQIGSTLTVGSEERRIPHMQHFSFDVQRALPHRVLLAVSYAGSRGSNLQMSHSINEVSAAQWAEYGTRLSGTQRNPFAGLIPGSTLNNATISLNQMLRPFPQYTTITENNFSHGGTWYNGLQARAEKRFSAGLQFMVNYTWSKALEALTYLNAQDAVEQIDRVLTAAQTPHRAVVTGGYALPFARHAKGFARALFQGWQTNGVFTAQRGVPVAAPGSSNSTGISPKLPDSERTRERWFNTCTLTAAGARQNCASPTEQPAFAMLPSYTLRTLGTRFPDIRTSPRLRGDFSLFKHFNVTERMRLQFRAEAFNVTNHPWFGQPTTSITSPSFGTINNASVNDPRQVQLALKLLF